MVTEDITPEVIAEKLAARGIVVEKEAEAPSEAPAAELSIEDQARAVGWRPDGPESAEIFLAKKPLFEAIKARGKEVKELAATVNELKAHLNKQEAAAYKRALADLKAERRQAISMGDVEAVEQIDQAMEKITPVAPVEAPLEPAVVEFMERNASWLNDPSMEAEEMRQWVKKRDEELFKFKLDPADHMTRLEADLKKKFNLDKPESTPISRVESEYDSSPVKGKKKVSFNDLSKEQKAACRHFEKRGIMKADEYIKQLQDLGEI